MSDKRLIDANALRQKIEKWADLADNSISFTDSVESFAYDEVLDAIDAAPTIDPESLRPVSEWELNPDRWTCEWFRCKTCHHISCCADSFCGGCGAKMKNAGASTDDFNEPKEETFDMG